MRSIKLLSIEKSGSSPEISTVMLIRGCLNATPEKGFTFDELKKRRRVDESLDKANLDTGELVLEDEDFRTLKNCVLENRWAIRSTFIEEFIQTNFLQ